VTSEQDLLAAKARVCDAYRAWLANPRRITRTPLCEALAKLAELEAQPVELGAEGGA